MTTQFEKLLENVIREVSFLTIADTRYVPGALLESQNVDRFTDRVQSFLVPDFFQQSDFRTVLSASNFALAHAASTFRGIAALSLLSFLGLKVSTNRHFEVSITVEEVKVRHYENPDMGLVAFERAFLQFKERDEDTFRLLRDRFLVFSSYYASRFRLEFAAGSGLEGEVEFDNSSVSVEAGAAIERQADVILVSNNISVPFAVSGYRVTKRGTILES
ncbi:hypothetical protein KR51_00000910 [Rubidibacter lacunae KORDI 51-2]|uniref:Uncharacterized protein n=1 Tax=Rubidibacter lacunae KORDI 51-2 TaxID=582515 RepID=U5DQT8_9CHRO|nr:hypothetical protein [Rubidibacter lacunae]ERN43197.1 hypothetical protein KR51_00000910 [Rubidibacter lacunae KORDI 51-2]